MWMSEGLAAALVGLKVDSMATIDTAGAWRSLYDDDLIMVLLKVMLASVVHSQNIPHLLSFDNNHRIDVANNEIFQMLLLLQALMEIIIEPPQAPTPCTKTPPPLQMDQKSDKRISSVMG
jgi:hypothetical protein